MLKKFGLQAVMVLMVLIGVGVFAAVSAQVSTVGTISGTVRDPKGASVPKAEVVIQQEGGGVTRTVIADDNGFYLAASLPVGRYSISTSPQGFKKTVASEVDLHIGENKVVNLDLQVGLISETVTVSSDAAPVETRSGDVSSLISEKQVTELPLNGRNYSQLALMVPGFSPSTNGSFAARGTGLDGGVDVSANGNGSNLNLWTVDGVNNMDVGSNRTLLVFPSIDSIAEFRVERNSFSAEYGQAQGAVINLITKGGSNAFHGAGFEFLRSTGLNANNFFLNKSNQPRPYLKYNNLGGNFSGPIWKNKIFFFWSEEWRFEDRGTTVQDRVPSAAEKLGDFSGVLTNPLPRDPFTGLPYPGNKIPAAFLSPAGLALMKIFPDPNGGGTPGSPALWISSPIQPVRTRQDSIRGDVNINSKMNMMVRFINEKWIHGQDTQQWGDVPFPTLADDWNQPSKTFSVKLTNTLNSTSVNDFQFSRAGNNIFISTAAQSEALVKDIASKFPTVFPQKENVPSLMWGGGGYGNIWHEAPWENHEDLWIWKDDFSKVVGSHDLKFGALYSHNIKNEQLGGGGGGNTPAFITGNSSKTGHAIADILDTRLTLTSYAETDHTGAALGRWRDTEFYGNDTWKIRPTVTLTLGLRYSQYPTANNANGEMSNFIPQFYDGVSYLSALITPATAGAHGLPASLVKPYNKGFQPRVGLAWDVFGNGKTALRMGFGRYMSRTNVIEDILRMAANPPWTKTVSVGWSGATDTLASCPACRTMDAIGPNLINQVAGASNSTAFAAVDINFRPPESYQWNLTVSRELMKNTVLEVSYIGNHGLHIWRRNVGFNDIPPGVPCKGGDCDPTLKNDARFQIASRTQRGLDTVAIIAANRRIPNLAGVTMSQSNGNSSYNGLQVWLNRRFSDRLAFQLAYTLAHNVSDVPLQAFTNATSDAFDYSLDIGDSDLDRRQTLVGNIVYSLPSFKKWGAAANHLLGDWQLNAIFSHYGNTPVPITSGFNTYGTDPGAGNINSRPDLVPGVPIYLHTADKTQWLNPAAFALPGLGELGNLGKGVIRGKTINSIDFSLAKNWKFKERYGLQFRLEMFNLFNHANFGGYNTNLGFEGNITRANFGQSTQIGAFGTLNSAQAPREIQLGLKFSF